MDIDVVNPADGSVLATVPLTSAAQVASLAADAGRVFRSGVWAGLAPRERAAAMLRLAGLMERDADVLARLDSEDAGKPITEAREGDIPGAIESIRWFAEAADKLAGAAPSTAPGVLAYTTREPFGVVAAILPWNYPLAMAAWKIGPALVAGNCLILKPADATPRSVLHVATLALEAGIPAGVLTVATGDGPTTGAALAADPRIGALSFTGSTATGRAILEASARSNLKRVSLEMGGKAPHVVMPDALALGDALIDGITEEAFLTAGQNCTAGSRVLVHESIHDEVVVRLAAAASALVIGDPANAETQVGPVIDDAAADRILVAIASAVERGAVAVAGGREVPVLPRGRYLAPTILAGVDPADPILTTEIFGPVMTVQAFATREEAIAMANAVDYGLHAAVWTQSLDDALALARGIEAGTVSVGAYSEGDMTVPFGGWKQSGFGGAEKSLAAFDQWTRVKTVWIQRP
ncbi:aldehyde dehydrogenase family protein [Demequina sp. NBRC 110055]|uniref:aldehyde dehydrogenase family protein n=1 Tax=Demequina sp. NBRC 110055 TaxID=1570344 RepID=UPI000A01FAE1|nr:aldehyde dehydrogenase family protein [Demequina sp. NBRC 110055]